MGGYVLLQAEANASLKPSGRKDGKNRFAEPTP